MNRNLYGPRRLVAAILLVSSAFPTAVSAQPPLFDAHKDYPSGYSPVAVAVGDVNGDSVPDLTANDSDKTVPVLLGSGDGTFHPVSRC